MSAPPHRQPAASSAKISPPSAHASMAQAQVRSELAAQLQVPAVELQVLPGSRPVALTPPWPLRTPPSLLSQSRVVAWFSYVPPKPTALLARSQLRSSTAFESAQISKLHPVDEVRCLSYDLQVKLSTTLRLRKFHLPRRCGSIFYAPRLLERIERYISKEDLGAFRLKQYLPFHREGICSLIC